MNTSDFLDGMNPKKAAIGFGAITVVIALVFGFCSWTGGAGKPEEEQVASQVEPTPRAIAPGYEYGGDLWTPSPSPVPHLTAEQWLTKLTDVCYESRNDIGGAALAAQIMLRGWGIEREIESVLRSIWIDATEFVDMTQGSKIETDRVNCTRMAKGVANQARPPGATPIP